MYQLENIYSIVTFKDTFQFERWQRDWPERKIESIETVVIYDGDRQVLNYTVVYTKEKKK